MSTSIRRGVIYSFDAATWTAVVQLDGSVGEVVMPVGEWVPSGMLAQDDAVAVLLFDDSNPDDGVIVGPYGGVGGWSYPQLSGLTAGQPLRATGAAAAAFGPLDLANGDAVTGALPPGKGGTGLSGTPSNGQVPIGNGSGYALAALAGTANRVTVTNGAGSITLSGPQDLAAASSPTFAGLTATGGLNVGSATGAGTGEIRASDKLRLSGVTGAAIKMQVLTLADNATGNLFTATDKGWVLITDDANCSALFVINGNSNATFELLDPNGVYAAASTAGMTSVEWNGATNYILRNRRGVTRDFSVTLIGRF